MTQQQLIDAVQAGLTAGDTPTQMVDRILVKNRDSGGRPCSRLHVARGVEIITASRVKLTFFGLVVDESI